MRANMQYNKTLIEKAVKFINNKNVEVEHFVAKDDETFNVCVDVHNNRTVSYTHLTLPTKA